ncbi:hypothetical protein CHS0354_014641 [Potamilus streckersoni]|uniref:Uncharacterized protein n=1 Tax=Potamilus streckersoni TaxID=2493646 RepID=A0AAE0SPK3_9BIVA|nr:hypothetical protein CHS0354_014641 [Potamilus streckersoni]
MCLRVYKGVEASMTINVKVEVIVMAILLLNTSSPGCFAAAAHVNTTPMTSVNTLETTATMRNLTTLQETVQPNTTGITPDTSSPECVAAVASVNTTSMTSVNTSETPATTRNLTTLQATVQPTTNATGITPATASVNTTSMTTSVTTSETIATTKNLTTLQTTVQLATSGTGITPGVTTKAVTTKTLKPLYLVPCLCPNGTIKQTIEEIIEEITINPKETSKATHLLISAADSRPSAAGIGTVAVVVLVLPLVIIVLSDLHSLVMHISNVGKTTRKAERKASIKSRT